MWNSILCPAVPTAISLPFARTENMQTWNPSTFESETRAESEDQISFIYMCYLKARSSSMFYSSKNERKTCMISRSTAWNKKSEVGDVVSCLHSSHASLAMQFWCLQTPLLSAQTPGYFVLHSLSKWRNSCPVGSFATLSLKQSQFLSADPQGSAPFSSSAHHCSLYGQGLSCCTPIPLCTSTRREEPHVLSSVKEPASTIAHPSRKRREGALVLFSIYCTDLSM